MFLNVVVIVNHSEVVFVNIEDCGCSKIIVNVLECVDECCSTSVCIDMSLIVSGN